MNNSNGKFHSLNANEKINVRFRLVIRCWLSTTMCEKPCGLFVRSVWKWWCADGVVLLNESAASARDSMCLVSPYSPFDVQWRNRMFSTHSRKWRTKNAVENSTRWRSTIMHNVRRLTAPTPLCASHVSQLIRTNSSKSSFCTRILAILPIKSGYRRTINVCNERSCDANCDSRCAEK